MAVARYVGEGALANRRQRHLDAALAMIYRRYGSQAVVKGKSAKAGSHPSCISTGFPALDRALGTGGLPRGRACELLGPATSGKTTLALKFLARAQAGGGQVGYVDQALYFDPDYAHRCGLDLSRLVVGRSHDLREALALTEGLIRSGSLAALVFDALDFLWTDAEASSLLAATLDRLPASLARSGLALLVLHESPTDRMAADRMSAGNVPTHRTPALSALAHHAAVRLQVVRERWLHHKYHQDIRGYEARVEILKNRLGPAGRTVSLSIEFNGTVRGNGL
jgi:recombination protein RecA